jgi:hypothetical protein
MDLIDRYLHEVGRYLPRNKRADILAELRSSLVDTLEGRVQGEAGEEDIVALLKEYGPPRKVAASYSSIGQYLIGPELYPLFRMIAGIVIAAVLGAQVLAFAVAVWIGEQQINPWESLAGLVNSIPMTLGMLVIVFAILQRFDVRPELDNEPWDPRSLPVYTEVEKVDRGELVVGIVAATVILGLLTFFPDYIGTFFNLEDGFFANPVIPRYLGWISLSLIASIGLDIYMLWRGHWTIPTRLVQIAVNLFSLLVIALLLQGHNAWLAEQGVGGFLSTLELLGEDIMNNLPIISMQAFRMGLGIALVVISIETVVQIFRLVRSILRRNTTPGMLPA